MIPDTGCILAGQWPGSELTAYLLVVPATPKRVGMVYTDCYYAEACCRLL